VTHADEACVHAVWRVTLSCPSCGGLLGRASHGEGASLRVPESHSGACCPGREGAPESRSADSAFP
jgi:hypothetical protein